MRASGRAGILFAGVWLLGAIGTGWAQPAISQFVAAVEPIKDEFGAPLDGTDASAPEYGVARVEGDLVQLLLTTDNTIHPPHLDGTPDPRNIVLSTTRIGSGVSPTLEQPAKFGALISPRPGGNSRIFARAFNAPSMGEATFYGDSQLFTVRSWKHEVFLVDIDATDKPLDINDDDGDGLVNSWERSRGTDPTQRDSDGDGLTDGEELLSQNDPLDAESFLVIVKVAPAGGDDAVLTWDSVEGVRYQVEMTTDDLAGSPEFTLVDSVQAGPGSETSLVVPDGLSYGQACYRVRVVSE
jgi:hypothetical protein